MAAQRLFEIMAKLKILEFPDPRLRTKATPVTTVDDALRVFIKEGQKVSMEVTQGQKGPQAENVIAE